MFKILMPSAFLLVMAGCSTMPTGPSVLVLPGTGKDFGLFKTDDADCRQLAFGQIAPAGKPPDSKEEGQQAYDITYIQCMYGKGHRVPVPAELSFGSRQEWRPPPPPNLPMPPAVGLEPATPSTSPSK